MKALHLARRRSVAVALIALALMAGGAAAWAGYTAGPAPGGPSIGYYGIYGTHGVFIGVGSSVTGLVGAADGTLSPSGIYNANGDAIHLNGTAAITGDARSGGNVNLQNNADITGTLIRPASTTLTMGSGATVGSDDTYDSVGFPGLPAATTLTCPTGGADYSGANAQSLTLTPGVYGALSYGGQFQLTLNGAGDYYFDSITTANMATLTAGAGTRVFVCGNAQFGSLDTFTASDFYFEAQGTDGHNAIKATGGSDLIGRFFAPNGGIHLGSSGGSVGSFTGNLWGLFVDIEKGVSGTGPTVPTHGRIIVQKVTDPAGNAGPFTFNPSWGDPAFTFTLGHGDSYNTDFTLDPGKYSVVETGLPAGWVLTSAVCDHGETASDIDVDAGETVTCTFNNSQGASLTVLKQTGPAGGTGFGFTTTGLGGATFTLNDDGAWVFLLLSPGTYGVAESTMPEGWEFYSASCVDQAGAQVAGSDLVPAVEVTLAAGNQVTCTFNNTQTPAGAKLTVVKHTTPAGGAGFPFGTVNLGGFSFELADNQSVVFSGLPAGTYGVGEQTPPEGWLFDSVSCVDDNTGAPVASTGGTAAAQVTLATDQEVTCTFTNTEMGRILVDKVTDPTGSPEEFTFEPSWDDDFRLADGDEPYDSGPLAPGGYSITEVSQPEDWILQSSSCYVRGNFVAETNGNGAMNPSAITLGPGQTVVCVFRNYDTGQFDPDASLTIVKDAIPADDTVFWFNGGSLGSFSLRDPANPSKTFTALAAGEYTVAELTTGLDDTWLFDGIDCDAAVWETDGRSVTVTLSDGEVAVCTFYNIEELPPTGAPAWALPAGAGGAAAMLGGLLLVLLWRRRRATAS